VLFGNNQVKPMQGEFDVNLDTFTGMQREFTKNAGREPNEEQTKAIKTLSDEVKKLTIKKRNHNKRYLTCSTSEGH